MKKFETWEVKETVPRCSPPREFVLCSFVGYLWDILGKGRIVVHARSTQSVHNGFEEIAANDLCWLSVLISSLFFPVWSGYGCMFFHQGVWQIPCASSASSGKVHGCLVCLTSVSPFFQSPCLLSSCQ